MDRYTETTYTGYGQNIGNSFKGIFLGIIFLIGSIILLWWNEGRSVDQATALNEMQEKIVTLPNTSYDGQYENRAVLVQGKVIPLEGLFDPEFGVKSDGLVLSKSVEMYQWNEKTSTTSQDKLGGGTETITTYDYVKEWSSSQIDSSSFKRSMGHQNPMMTRKDGYYVTPAQMGDFSLDKTMVSHIGAYESYAGLASMPDYIGDAKNYKSFLYLGINPQMPMIGDMKITYLYAPSAIYTFAAKEQGKALVPYVTDNGKSFVFVRNGKVDSMTIFKEELDANSLMTWILRGVGLLVMFFGFTMIMGPVATLAKVIPMLGSLVGGVTSLVAGAFTLVLGSMIIALAWFSSRPLMSLTIIAVGIGIAFALGKLGKKSVQAVKETYEGNSEPRTPPSRTNTPPPRPPVREEDSIETGTPPPRER